MTALPLDDIQARAENCSVCGKPAERIVTCVECFMRLGLCCADGGEDEPALCPECFNGDEEEEESRP